MSDARHPGDEEDVRAGEYVLGLGTRAERRAFEAEMGRRPSLMAAVAAWERHLAPALLAIPRVEPPPGLWPRLERSMHDKRPRDMGPAWTSRLVAGAAGFALAAAIAVFAWVAERPAAPPVAVAALLPRRPGAPVLVAWRAADGALVIRAIGGLAAPKGQDYELWSLPAHAQRPVALGLLHDGGATVAQAHVPHTEGQILVSLEPAGGSPTGLPTGAVLWGADYGGGG